MGAWIETQKQGELAMQNKVAPYVGAWIETINGRDEFTCSESHPMWVRGLKHVHGQSNIAYPSRTLCGCVD